MQTIYIVIPTMARNGDATETVPTGPEPTGDPNLVYVMNLLARIVEKQATPSNLMPELIRGIPEFRGLQDGAVAWLENLTSVQQLHQLTDQYTLELARSKLSGSARVWYDQILGSVNNWGEFQRGFRRMYGVQKTRLIAGVK